MSRCLHTFPSLLLIAALGGTASGEVVGIGASFNTIYARDPQGGSSGALAFVLYVVSNSADDNIIGVSDAQVHVTGTYSPYGFYNASPNPGVDPIAGGAPLTGIDWFAQPQMLADSYVTIGGDGQSALTNTTVLDPTFDDALFLSDGSVGDGAGWHNSDPTNGQGMVDHYFGSTYRLYIGVFSILLPDFYDEQDHPHLAVDSMTITYTTGLFGTDLHQWTLTTPLSLDYIYWPTPGTAVALAMLGLIAQRRRGA
jgi:hypothetical protein